VSDSPRAHYIMVSYDGWTLDLNSLMHYKPYLSLGDATGHLGSFFAHFPVDFLWQKTSRPTTSLDTLPQTAHTPHPVSNSLRLIHNNG